MQFLNINQRRFDERNHTLFKRIGYGVALIFATTLHADADGRSSGTIQDVPLSISALGDAEKQLADTDAVEGLRTAVPIISPRTVTDFGGGYVTGFQIRGLDPTNPIVRGMGNQTGRFTSQLEQVEVLRGPQGNLFGAPSIQFFGQSNSAYVDVDNGNPDGDNSGFSSGPGTFAGFELMGMVNGNYAGARVAGSFGNNQRNHQNDFEDFGCRSDEPDPNVCLYTAHAYIASPEFGRITVGLGETAFNGIGDINLAGINYVTNANPNNELGHREAFGLGRTWDEVTGHTAGVGRSTNIRYDSPTVSGFVLSASWGDSNTVDAPADAENVYDVALRYAGEFGALRVAAGAGYQVFELDDADNLEQSNFTGSASVFHTPTGLFINGTATSVNRDADVQVGAGETDSGSYYRAQIGVRLRWTELGDTVLYGQASEGDSTASAGNYFVENSSFSGTGFGMAQEMDEFAGALYLFYGSYEAEVGGVTADDADVVLFGARIKY